MSELDAKLYLTTDNLLLGMRALLVIPLIIFICIIVLFTIPILHVLLLAACFQHCLLLLFDEFVFLSEWKSFVPISVSMSPYVLHFHSFEQI